MRETVEKIMKIIRFLGGLFLVVLIVMAILGAFDDAAEKIGNAGSSRDNDTKASSSRDVSGDGKSAGADKNRNVSLQAGNSYKLKNSCEALIKDIDIIYDFNSSSTIGYVTVEYTNNSDEMKYLSPNDISAFVDDFQEPVDTGVAITIDGVEYNGEPLAIDPGRKGRYAYFTLFPISGESAEKVELSLYGGSILYKEAGEWLYEDERADAIKAQTQVYLESVEAEREFYERYEALPMGVVCPDEFYGAYIDGLSCMLEGVDLLGIIPGTYANTTSNSRAIATVGEDGTLSLKKGVLECENAALDQDLSGAYSIRAETDYKVGFLGSGYIYIWTPDEEDPNNMDEGFYEKIE